MNWLTILLLILGGISALFLIIGFALPAKWRIEESIDIRIPQDEVFRFVATIKNWEQWTTWNRRMNENYVFSYEGPSYGSGARQTWKLKGNGGSLEFQKTDPPGLIEYELNMGKGGIPMKGSLSFENLGEQTRVVWASWGENKTNPAGRILMKLFSPYMRNDFKQGLVRLREIMQGG